MKFRKLTIHNIASIEDAEIDFASRPLSDSDVFLITGKTGSGKSTILDAVCLALYGTTPRLENTSMEGAVEDAGKDVKLDSPSQLLRENTGEGWVNLTFEGSDGASYQAEWSIARARGKADGRLQSRKWTVTDLDSNTKCTKEDEIVPMVQKAVGLTFGQFCRTTMLAQGPFTRFLDSKDDEKAEILEKITGADVYAKIGAMVFAKAQEKRSAWEAADAAIAGITVLTEEELHLKEEELAGKNKEMESAKGARDEAGKKADWLKEDAELSERRKKAEDTLAAAKAAVETEDYLRKKVLVNSWKETAEARRNLGTVSLERVRAEEAGQAIGRMAGRYLAVRAGLAFLDGREKSMQKELDDVRKTLEAYKPDIEVIRAAQMVETQLDIISEGGTAISRWRSEIGSWEKVLSEDLGPAQKKADEDFTAAKAEKERTAAALEDADKALKDAGLDEVRKEKDKLAKEQPAIAVARERIRQLDEVRTKLDKEREALDRADRNLEARSSAIDAKNAEEKELAAAEEAGKKRYDAVSSAVENFIGDIRNRLKVGDVCPVCMREITAALPSDSEVEARVAPVREAWEKARDARETCERELRNMEASYKADKGSYDGRKAQYDKAEDLAKATEAAMEAVKACGFDTIDEDTDRKLSERNEEISVLLSNLRKEEVKGIALETERDKAQKADGEAAWALDATRDVAEKARKKVDETKQNINKVRALEEEKRSAVGVAVRKVDAAVRGSRWEGSWQEPGKDFRGELEEELKSWEDATRREGLLNDGIRTVSTTAKAVEDVLSEVEGRVPAWKSMERGPAAELGDIEKAARALNGDVIVECGNERTANDALREAADKVEGFLKEHTAYDMAALERLSAVDRQTIDEYEKSLKKLDDAATFAGGALESILGQVETHEAKRPRLAEGDTTASLVAEKDAFDAKVVSLAGEVKVLEEEIRSDGDNRKKAGQLADEADKLRGERDLWDRLNQLIGDATGKKFRKIAQSYVLGSLVEAANRYMKELTDRYTLKVLPGTFVILLEDAWQGYASRPASTISGGETFLVSLSLALALSDIGDGLSVDTMFIDEGFGTLSGEPLQNAVNTLKTLRTKGGRHVGIISHIEELQEKIPVKVKVEMNARTGSSTVEVVSD